MKIFAQLSEFFELCKYFDQKIQIIFHFNEFEGKSWK